MNKTIKEILKEMCKRVGANLKDIDVKSSNWFQKYSWTEKEQDSFADWLVEYIKGSADARIFIMAHPSKDIKSLKKLANEFVNNYGWKMK